MTFRPAVLLGPLLFEDENLPAPPLGEDSRLDRHALGILRLFARLSGKNHAVERKLLPLGDLVRRLLNPDDVSRRDLQLFSPGADDGVHGSSRSRTANDRGSDQKVKPRDGRQAGYKVPALNAL